VATVVPWKTPVTSPGPMPAIRQSSTRPSTIACSGAAGVEGTLCTCTAPAVWSNSIRSVKVPPMSTPTTRLTRPPSRSARAQAATRLAGQPTSSFGSGALKAFAFEVVTP